MRAPAPAHLEPQLNEVAMSSAVSSLHRWRISSIAMMMRRSAQPLLPYDEATPSLFSIAVDEAVRNRET
jgi:hypothetical protein